MDFETQLRNRLRRDITYQRQFLRNTVMSAIANDPYIEEVSKVRVKSLAIAKSESDDFATRLGMFINRQLLSIRRHTNEDVTRELVWYLTTVPCPLDEFFAYFNSYVYKGCECGEWFKAEEPRHYLHFLIIISEFCCKMVDLDELEICFSMVFQCAECYMNLFQETLPEYEVFTDSDEDDLPKNMPEYCLTCGRSLE